jgi:hypothetical protein
VALEVVEGEDVKEGEALALGDPDTQAPGQRTARSLQGNPASATYSVPLAAS